MFLRNLLIVAGTGTKSGKTTMVCKVIEQFREIRPVAVKISPHFHETPGLVKCASGEGYGIYRETNDSTTKDTSRMLRAGAEMVYLVLAWDASLKDVFSQLLEFIPADTPIVCESPALRNYFEPGVFIIMTSGKENKRQDLNYLQELPHLKFRLDELESIASLPLNFSHGSWMPL